MGEGYDVVVLGCSELVAQAGVRVSVVDGDEIGDEGVKEVGVVVEEQEVEEVDRWNRKNECLSTHLDQGGVVLHEAETGIESEKEWMGTNIPSEEYARVVVGVIKRVGWITRNRVPNVAFAMPLPFQERIAVRSARDIGIWFRSTDSNSEMKSKMSKVEEGHVEVIELLDKMAHSDRWIGFEMDVASDMGQC
jgi:hypothetical protein